MSQQNQEPGSEIILYQTEDGRTRLEVKLENETVWLSQKQLAELFQKDVRTINDHIQNVFAEGELQRGATIRKYRIVQTEGARSVEREVDFYNLDVIISIGYRVKSQRGTQFRIWATQRLREYIAKGFVLDDERLKNPPGPGATDYFNDLLERIRDIRASERRMYLRVREILALAADYQPEDHETQVFFQTVQNKLHFATSGKTAPELIAERADANKPNMGLTTWRGGIVRKGDVTIAKNYLNEEEITSLNRVVTMFLDFAEDQAKRRKQVFMRDWRTKLDDFLKLNERGILKDAGKITREEADRYAETQYSLFEERRRKELEAKGEAEFSAGIAQLEGKVKKIASSKPKRKK
ncbi:MAG: virulence RhuM family protein [Limisphaerales bacterium]